MYAGTIFDEREVGLPAVCVAQLDKVAVLTAGHFTSSRRPHPPSELHVYLCEPHVHLNISYAPGYAVKHVSEPIVLSTRTACF